MKSDIERTSGISDPVSGSDSAQGAAATATGVQLVQAAANVRIQLKSKNLARELLRPAAEQWKWLYRQNIHKSKPIRANDPQSESGYSFYTVGPAEANADFDFEPEGGSWEPPNPAQERADAITLLQALEPIAGAVDISQAVLNTLKAFNIPNPDKWLTGQQVPGAAPPQGLDPQAVIPLIAQALQAAGADQQTAQNGALAVAQEAMQQAQQSPAPNGSTPQPAGAAQ